MTSDQVAEPRFPAGALRAFIARAFTSVGMSAENADHAAHLMVEADLSGFDSHGIFRLRGYVTRIKAGGLNPRPEIRIARETDSTALVHGDNGLGHLVVRRAAQIAMDKAQDRGIGWVGTVYSNHAGAASTYAVMPLERDMIGLYCAVGSANHLPPWGGIDSLLSTNPIAVAVPAFEEPPVVMDFATTVASNGKIKSALQRGESIPEGWVIDREGRPITDPARADEGFLLPMGGHKGYALGLVIGLLAGTLNGAAMGDNVIDFHADQTTAANTGQFICAISLAAFGDIDAFKKRVDEVSRSMRASATLPGVDSVKVPGDGRAAKRADYLENGVPVHPALVSQLHALADELSIEPLS